MQKSPSLSDRALLATMGLNPFVVQQAIEYLRLRSNLPSSLHILTTQVNKESCQQLVSQCEELGISLTISIVESVSTFKDQHDFQVFEETCFRWYANLARRHPSPLLFVGGGMKLMTIPFQRASQLFGSSDSFHLLAKPGEETKELNGVEDALKNGILTPVHTGGEPGWPAFLDLAAREPLKISLVERNPVFQVIEIPPDLIIRTRIEEMLGTIQNYISTDEDVPDTPFPGVLLFPPHLLAWLHDPLTDSRADQQFILTLPKIELHCHLGGFATHGKLLTQIRAKHQDPPALLDLSYPKGWPRPEQPILLSDYMHLGDNNGSRLLTDNACLKTHCHLLYRHLVSQRIRYAEIRCSPANYRGEGQTSQDVLENIRCFFQEEMNYQQLHDPDNYCRINLIIIATRRKEFRDLSSISRHLALAITASEDHRYPDCLVVGVDLAGYESRETRAAYFREDFRGIHRCGLAITVHAGENDDAEAIWSAIYDLHARRLGHALHLVDSSELIRTVIDRAIGVEMCPYANYQIKGFMPMKGRSEYPLMHYMKQGVLATVNTDNIGISQASLSENLMFLREVSPGIRRMDILYLLKNSLETSFLSKKEKERMVALFNRQIVHTCLNLDLSN